MLKSVIAGLAAAAPMRSAYTIGASPTCVHSVRWHRKPRWVPVAKSKMFRVPERKPEDPEERAELMRLHQNYKTQIRAIRSYLIEECRVQALTSSADHLVVTPEEEQQQFDECVRINDDWNATIAAERDERLNAKLAERKAWIAERLELKLERDQAALDAAEETVRREKELSTTYILKANLNEAIEYALANPVDYNFAIDLQGNRLAGRVTDAKDVHSVATAEQQRLSA